MEAFDRFRSLLGLAVLIGIAFAMSGHRGRVDWRLVATGVGLQFALGLFVASPLGQATFSGVNVGVQSVLNYAGKGSDFVFGKLTGPEMGAMIAFSVLPTIIFFSSLMAVLYHLGLMERLIQGLAWVMQRTLRTSGPETLSAAGNIFVGQTEAPLMVRPFLAKMSRSELMAVMTGGFATVAGGVMVAYVQMLQGVFPEVAGHMLSASIMSAPAALVMAKIIVPETETPSVTGAAKLELPRDVNLIDAAARGASEGLQLALNVGAMLIAFVALIAMVNGILGGIGGWFGFGDLSLEWVLGVLLAPLAWVMGVPWSDAAQVGSLLGTKTVLNEFIAYQGLAQASGELSPRSQLIAVYALCGFANFASIAIQLGGLGPLAPERRKDLAQLALRAMIAGNLAAFMTACVMGLLR